MITGLKYSCTNENPAGIVAGLVPSQDDSILTVAGSGDQAFALLEFAGRVKAVDILPAQIEFMRQRVEALRAGNYEKFLGPFAIGISDGVVESSSDSKRRQRDYFLKGNARRLMTIRAKLDNLVIAEPGDISEIAQSERGFSKVYLSNALSEALNHNHNRKWFWVARTLEGIAMNLPRGGLIYVADHSELKYAWEQKWGRGTNANPGHLLSPDKDLKNETLLLPELKLDVGLSRKARKYETGVWSPAVYLRI